MRKLTILSLSLLMIFSVTASAQPRATFDSVWVDYDIEEEGLRGMRIHLKFWAYGMKDMDAYVAIYFQYNDELGDYLKDKNGKFNSTAGDVAVYRSIKPAYDPAVYNDLTLFMPYSELDLGPGDYDLTMDIKVIYQAGGVISRLTYYDFEYTKPANSPGGGGGLSKIDPKFEDLWVDYDVTEGGRKGMRIHVKFTVNNMKDVDGYVAIYFEKKNGDKIMGKNSAYRSTSGQLAVFKSIRPSYIETVYKDIQLFMPYDEINIPPGKYDLKLDFDIIMKNGDLVKHMKDHDFWFEH